MTMVVLGDVLPAVSALGSAEAERLLRNTDWAGPIEEIPAERLIAEWLNGGRLEQPIAARLAVAILENARLRLASFLHIAPDLVRAVGRIGDSFGLSEGSVQRLGVDADVR